MPLTKLDAILALINKDAKNGLDLTADYEELGRQVDKLDKVQRALVEQALEDNTTEAGTYAKQILDARRGVNLDNEEERQHLRERVWAILNSDSRRAEERARADDRITFTRSLVGSVNCPWCVGLAGTYDWLVSEDNNFNLFTRHKGCDCRFTITRNGRTQEHQGFAARAKTESDELEKLFPAITDESERAKLPNAILEKWDALQRASV